VRETNGTEGVGLVGCEGDAVGEDLVLGVEFGRLKGDREIRKRKR
jgi:hypothetical protein